jgi:hypothetical protein
MLILLGTSTLAAALVPAPAPREETTDTTSSSTSPLPTGGEFVKEKLDADARRPARIQVSQGDQVNLLVRSREAGQIEITGLGLLDDVLPLSPARFDVLATRRGRFEIRMVEPRRLVGILEVVPAAES